MALVQLIANQLEQTNSRMFLTKVDVYLGTQLYPTPVPGFQEILKAQISQSEINALLSGSKFFTPFTSFKINPSTTGNAGQLVDQLMSMNSPSQNTSGLTKTFTLFLDPQDSVDIPGYGNNYLPE
jgi:hypothetical protein